MSENIVELIHMVEGNIIVGKHQPSPGTKLGVHTQEWYGDRFISGIQAEDLKFIVDETGNIIFDE